MHRLLTCRLVLVCCRFAAAILTRLQPFYNSSGPATSGAGHPAWSQTCFTRCSTTINTHTKCTKHCEKNSTLPLVFRHQPSAPNTPLHFHCSVALCTKLLGNCMAILHYGSTVISGLDTSKAVQIIASPRNPCFVLTGIVFGSAAPSKIHTESNQCIFSMV